jgi:hypothetical protein
MSDNAADANPTRGSRGFFAIDRGAFRCAAVGGFNAAAAHLVMARGTGPDNRTTISRPNAAKAVKDLLDRGIWKKIRDGQHPIYEAVCGDQISGRISVKEANAIHRDGRKILKVFQAVVRDVGRRGRS